MTRLDVSMPLFAGMPAFPGDPLFSSRPTHSIARGDAYNVSALSLGSHSGTHVDPPCHFVPGGPTLDQIDLDRLNGPCRVVLVPDGSRSVDVPQVEAVPDGTERVLFRTENSGRWARSLSFFSDYVALTEAAAQALLAKGTRLVGVDSLSVESDPTGRFPVHHRLLGEGALIVEGLLLADAAPGDYSIDCLPLRIRGGDGGPARVTLTPR